LIFATKARSHKVKEGIRESGYQAVIIRKTGHQEKIKLMMLPKGHKCCCCQMPASRKPTVFRRRRTLKIIRAEGSNSKISVFALSTHNAGIKSVEICEIREFVPIFSKFSKKV
jgi:hypothetical protein